VVGVRGEGLEIGAAHRSGHRPITPSLCVTPSRCAASLFSRSLTTLLPVPAPPPSRSPSRSPSPPSLPSSASFSQGRLRRQMQAILSARSTLLTGNHWAIWQRSARLARRSRAVLQRVNADVLGGYLVAWRSGMPKEPCTTCKRAQRYPPKETDISGGYLLAWQTGSRIRRKLDRCELSLRAKMALTRAQVR